MARAIGVLATRYIWVGLVEGTKLGEVRMYPQPGHRHIDLKSLPVDEILGRIRTDIAEVCKGTTVDSVGAGFPGIVHNGVIEESPNLGQLKGLDIGSQLCSAL